MSDNTKIKGLMRAHQAAIEHAEMLGRDVSSATALDVLAQRLSIGFPGSHDREADRISTATIDGITAALRRQFPAIAVELKAEAEREVARTRERLADELARVAKIETQQKEKQ